MAGTLAALVAVEVGVRVLAPQPGTGAGLLRGPLTTPGDHRVTTDEYDVTVHVNAAGFVDREWPDPAARPAGRREIVVIGDSFVQAAQVRPGEGFGARLEAELDATGLDTDVLSMGVPGAGQATELGVLREYALPRKPDLVVLGFLVANDVLNNHPLLEGKDDKPFYTTDEDGVLVPVEAADYVVRGPVRLLWDLSAAWRWGTRALQAKAIAERKLALGQGMPIDLRVHDPACVGGRGREERCAAWDEAWWTTFALLAQMAEECGDIPFVVVLFPDRVQVEDRADWPAAAAWDFSEAQARAAETAGYHAPVLDLLPGLRAAGGSLYLPKDGHWTARGHAEAARLTAPFVREHLD